MSTPKLNVTSNLLSKLLSKIEPVNFKSVVFKDKSEVYNDHDLNDRKLYQRELIVCVVDKLIQLAETNEWGLCKIGGFIYLFTGEYWSKIDEEEFKGFLGNAACNMGLRRTDAKYYEFQDRLFNQFLSSARLNVEIKNDSTTLINLKNGTFEISSEIIGLRTFNKGDALTYQLPFDYEEESECLQFKEYLNRVLPDVALQNILSEFIGYIFAKNLKLEKCLLLYGSGANGKSVFFEICNALLGKENISNFTLSNLAEEHNRAFIGNKLLNYGSEIRSSVDADLFKQLVSGEPVQCRFKYKDSFSISNYARLCFNCNELPREVEHNNAFFRRFLIIPFEVTIPEEDQNPELAKEIISKELSGIFNWVLAGLNRLLENKQFTYSDKAALVLKEYREQSDSVFLFLEDSRYIRHAKSFKLIKHIYPLYRTFCFKNGMMALQKVNFNRRLKALGFDVSRRNIGIGVNIIEEQLESNQE